MAICRRAPSDGLVYVIACVYWAKGILQGSLTHETGMPVRAKKLVGTFILLAWLAVYTLLCVQFSIHWLPDSHLARLIFFPLAGILWVFPVRPLLLWMRG